MSIEVLSSVRGTADLPAPRLCACNAQLQGFGICVVSTPQTPGVRKCVT